MGNVTQCARVRVSKPGFNLSRNRHTGFATVRLIRRLACSIAVCFYELCYIYELVG